MSIDASSLPPQAHGSTAPHDTGVPAETDSLGALPQLTLVTRQTALVLFAVLTACIGAIWWSELRAGLIATSDRVAYPILMLWFVGLIVLAWRRPHQLLMTQGLVTVGVGAYLVCTIAYALLIEQTITVYATASMAYWCTAAHLLFFFTWPAKPALALSLSVTTLTSLPALILHLRGTTIAQWDDVLWPTYINGFFAQVIMGLVVFGIALQLRRLLHIAPAQQAATGTAYTVNEFIDHRMRDLELARDAAEQASQAKSRFLAVMSHELRTPLHGVLGAADLLREAHLSHAQREALLDTVKHGGTHLLHLINDVLDLSRIEAGRIEIVHDTFDLLACLDHVRESISPQAQAKRLRLNVKLASGLPPHVIGDEFRIKQTLLNLLGNAVKFTDQGSVSLEAAYDTTRGEILLRIQDTGIGIAAPEQSRVFEAFHQADNGSTRRFAGTGLGLTITRQLVQLMGGRIVLDSEPGVGTRVQLQLPLPISQSNPDEAPISTMAAITQDLEGARVLLVDDDPINTMIAEQMLKSSGVSVRTVHCGQDALDALGSDVFDIVLMDWLMPGMDGLEATRRMRAGAAGETARKLPVIGLTAHAFAEDRAACLQAGMDEVLVKPVSQIQLLRALQRVLEAPHKPRTD